MDVSIGRLHKFSAEGAGDASAHLLALKAFRSLLSHLQKASRELRASADLRCRTRPSYAVLKRYLRLPDILPPRSPSLRAFSANRCVGPSVHNLTAWSRL